MKDAANNQRVQSAAMRAIESCNHADRVSTRMLEELEDATPVHGIPVTDLDEEDSAVIAVGEAITSNGGTIPKRRARTDPGKTR
jgi:hypothetical protein